MQSAKILSWKIYERVIIMASKLKRVSVGLNDDKYDFFKSKSEKSGVPISAVITMALDQYIDSQKMLESLPQLLESIKNEQEKKTKG